MYSMKIVIINLFIVNYTEMYSRLNLMQVNEVSVNELVI